MSEKSDLKKSITYMRSSGGSKDVTKGVSRVRKPITRRYITPQKTNSLMDEDVPDIDVEPLKRTALQTFKREIVKSAGKLADWLWKTVHGSKNLNDLSDWVLNKNEKIITNNRSKNNNKIVNWILNQKDKIINKISPPTTIELMDLSRKTRYTLS